MECTFAVVPKEKAEETRLRLLEKGWLRTDVAIVREGGNVLLPVVREMEGCEHVRMDASQKETKPSDYRELVDLPEALALMLPSSFDIIGGIALVKMPEELGGHWGEIGEAIIAANSSIQSVYMDRGVTGTQRVRDLEWIAGERGTTTTHREFGISLAMDISKVYFSPRLATERNRVCQLVRDGEAVLDMFAGVGPFSIMIARNSKPSKVHAIDINPDAVRYLRQNAAGNKVGELIVPILGDAMVEAPRLRADRIIMNLPHSSFHFFDAALSAANPGAVIHFYEILEEGALDGRLASLEGLARARAASIEINATREVHTYSPSQKMYAVDIGVAQHQ